MVNQPIEQPGTMNIDEFKRLSESEGAFELDAGEITPLVPLDDVCANVSERLYQALQKFLQQTELGMVFARTTYALFVPDTPLIKHIRVPDLMYYRKSRLEAMRQLDNFQDHQPIIIPPDMTTIIVSGSELFSVVDLKLDRYLRDNVQVVWIVDVQREIITQINRNVYKKFPAGTILPGGIQGYTPGGGVIPGFEMPVKTLFE